ncbi:ADYC domain-containing protein [Hyalangium sp.]|uniref:ADYC domain-containing protein n=1 Tax=Hyalangium sp. TaxID=2028555 RepID=UPI002D4F5527|nr:ADYC domain-containing protein [Hyalangium sp.]HYH94645.1 ADYC domain-containing protein [Hyalangium sp.]
MGARFAMVAAMIAGGVMGCGSTEPAEAPAPTLGTSMAALVQANGREINGREINGREINGSELGSKLVSVRYDGARREGMSTAFDEMWLEGSVFHALSGSEELSGVDFQQVRFTGTLEDGSTLTLRVDEVYPGTGVDQDVWSYRVSYQHTTTGEWSPICTNADGSAANAIPLEGRWDYRQGVLGGGDKIHDTAAFTFACEGAALSKCVRFGYKPWQSVNGVSLADHHQSCTRMIRADFCGDGTSYTVDGNWVNLYDAVNIQADTESWVHEAEWNTEGASCFSEQTRATTPIQCGERMVTTCGKSFSTKALLISETPPHN